MRSAVLVVATAMLFVTGAHAGFNGEKKITLKASDGTSLQVGTVTLTDKGDRTGIDVKLDSNLFEVNFISMRNFECLGSSGNRVCHLPYGYSIRNEITKDDLRDLEYHLLFVFVKAGAPGFDAFNGLYYKLKSDNAGNFFGTLMEVDLNPLAVPPDEEYARPISEFEMVEAPATKFKFTNIEIR